MPRHHLHPPGARIADYVSQITTKKPAKSGCFAVPTAGIEPSGYLPNESRRARSPAVRPPSKVRRLSLDGAQDALLPTCRRGGRGRRPCTEPGLSAHPARRAGNRPVVQVVRQTDAQACGSRFDTELDVYTGPSLLELEEVYWRADGRGDAWRADFKAAAGIVYRSRLGRLTEGTRACSRSAGAATPERTSTHGSMLLFDQGGPALVPRPGRELLGPLRCLNGLQGPALPVLGRGRPYGVGLRSPGRSRQVARHGGAGPCSPGRMSHLASLGARAVSDHAPGRATGLRRGPLRPQERGPAIIARFG
jgi:hypothetical protein